MDREHPLPLYYQLIQEIRDQIGRGRWKPGDLFPSERELCKTYGVSRITVRYALAELVDEGLLQRSRGRGTFVAKPKIRKQLSRLTSFTEDMRARGKRAAARVLRLEMLPASLKVAAILQVEPGEMVLLVERLRLANDEPVGIESSHLSFQGCEAILQEDLSGSLYQLLGERFGLLPARAYEEMEVGVCSPREADILGVHHGQPVMRIRRRTVAQSQQPFEYVESTYRADNYVFSVELIPGE